MEDEVDALVLGSGAAGLTAALTAAVAGLRVLVLEKTDRIGGTSAMSGAGTWIPANHHAEAAGIADSPAEALAYIRAAAPEGWAETEDALWQRLVTASPAMLRFVEAHSPLRFRLTPEGDPLRHLPGAKPRGRMLSPLPLSRFRAGRFAFRIRRSTIPEIFTYHEAVETDLYHHPWRTALRLWPRLAWRLLTNSRGKGTALITGLVRGCLDAGVRIEHSAQAVELVQDESGAVTGAVVEQGGRRRTLRARRGVVIATGGFEWDAVRLERHFPGPVDYLGSPPGNTGDGHRLAEAAGAALAHMDQATLTPAVPVRHEGRLMARPVPFHTEPNAILVNRYGVRFVNELTFNIGEAMDARDAAGQPRHLPCWVIADARLLERLPPARWAAQDDPAWLRQADSLAALAARIGLDPAALEASVARYNAACAAQKDAEFGRPSAADAAASGDRRRRGGLEAITRAPFLAMPFNRAILGTKGGPRTNDQAEVLRPDGSVIAGLFAAGASSANPLGTRGVGTGTTIGPYMAWGHVAGLRLAQRNG
ncbi:FAD-dependent oxidoreductase [Falsiroseomonas selenitidurans]|uniref:FAD-dependent oxidoreductase n=1 Tax=Falsiroseomonas selenitidurans TaxID=2716335 RepID=A0ABX1E3T5_9PROT|nr:FAD-dependent oxidoreductase [Falsiroseomonas selenitidurans]NKC30473.1 FAD-dependent oxidoreductase [Falsiroseomonas selenitidurans]